MKRFLLLISVLMLSVVASWAQDVVGDGIYYNLNKANNTAEVTYYGSPTYSYEHTSSISIPESISYKSVDYSVTSIGISAFKGCSGLTSVTIPNSVTSIGDDAFFGCSGLTKVNYLGSVEKWMEIDFGYSSSNPTYYAKDLYVNGELLTDVKITSADSIKKYAFYNCKSIKSVEIGNSVTSIGGGAFSGCSGLTSVEIPNSVTSIGGGAFSGCSGLTSVEIPNSVTSIGGGAFSYCSGLTSVVWNAKNCSDVSGGSFSPFYDISSNITSFTFGNEVEHIPAYLCEDMGNLKEVTIPNSVTSIGKYAFMYCSALTKVNYLGSVDKWVEFDFKYHSNPTYYAKDLYVNGELLTDVKITSADSIKEYAFDNCKSIKSVELGTSVTSIGNYAFYGCSGLTSVSIPNSVTSIGGGAFSGCSGLTSVTIPNSVTFIGSSAFNECSGLTSVVWNAKNCSDVSGGSFSPFYDISSNISSFTFGNEVEHIPAYLCYYMSGIKEITISNSVTSIGNYAFSGCSGLSSVTIGDGVTYIDIYAFSGCSGLTSVVWNAKNCSDFSYSYSSPTSPFYGIRSNITSFTLGNEVEHIPAYLCYDMDNLEEITIHNTITSIGSSAFENCSGLTSVTIPNSVTSIGDDAFYKCIGLTKVNYLGSVDKWVEIDFYNSYSNPTYYAEDLYINGELLTDVKISTANSIKSCAFYNCASIKSVEIGNSVTYIGDYAFSYCSGLTSVVWNTKNYSDFSDYDDSPFYNIRSNITSFTFGNEVEHIPAYLCYEMDNLEEITIGNTVTSIGSSAFSYCSGLTSVVWNTKNYSDFSDSDDSPFYNIRSNITSFTFGNEVEHIPAYLCYEMDNLEEIAIHNTVTSIGISAFYNCSGLTKVNYLGSVDKWVEIDFIYLYSNPTYYAKDLYINGELITDVKISSADGIKKYAFYNCESIKSVEIGNSVTSIGESAFYGCSGLTSVVWNANNYKISSHSSSPFYDIRSQITSFTIGNEVDYIQKYLCYEMENLEEVIIPNSVTSIGSSAFYNCSSSTIVNYLGTVEEWIGIDFESYSSSPTYYAKDLYINGELLTDVKISTADSIKKYAFYNCKSIKSVEIGNSVTSIGSSAFSGCSGLTKVNYLGSVDKWVEIDFEGYSSNPTYYAEDLYINGELLTDVKISTADSIKSCAFYNCASIKSVELGSSVTLIGDDAFYGCSGLTSVTIGNSVTSIGEDAFYNCSGLTKVNYLGSIDKWVEIYFGDFFSNPTFYAENLYINGELLTDVKITSADSIKFCAFYNCASIKSVEIGNSVTSIGSSAFENCYGLTSVTIGNSVTSIGYDAFFGCAALTSVTIPNSVTSIGNRAFMYCSGLTSVNIGNNVTSISDDAFNNCSSLTSVVWNVKYYEDFSRESSSPFYNSDITSFIIGNEVEYVPAYLCCDNNNLTSVIIGENVRYLGAQVFKGCDNLKRVTAYPKSVPSVYENTFAHYNAYLYVPCDVYENYDLHNVFGSFKYIKCIAADEVEAPEKVEIEVDENNNATVIWPSINSASSYELVISKDGTTFCTLLFNENGQLTSIDFGNRSASVGFQFTVTGLDGASKYDYKLLALDENYNELQSYYGEFETNGYVEGEDDEEGDDNDPGTAILETLADANITISDGTISADTNFTIYNTVGQNVTNLNGALTPGVYVVQVVDDFVKVMMK